MQPASRWWRNRRGARGEEGISDDAKAIYTYSLERYVRTGLMEMVFSQRNELVQDIIDYAMFYFIRDVAIRCRASFNQVPAVLTMSSLSGMFIPALFSYNLRRLGTMKKKDFGSRVANIFFDTSEKHEEKSSKFNTNLAAMIVQDHFDPSTNAYLKKPLSNIPSFGPSMGEIDAAFSLAYSMDESPLVPPVGSSILLMAIAKAMGTLPGMQEELRTYYAGSVDEETGHRRAYTRELNPTFHVLRELTPLFFAACCTQLLQLGKTMESIQVQSSDILERDTELGTSLRFHVCAFPSAMVPTIKETIVAAFIDTASTWIYLRGPRTKETAKQVPLSLDRVAMSPEGLDTQILDRTKWFFSVVLAMIYAISPTRENVEPEQEGLFEHVLSTENGRLLPFLQARGDGEEVLIGEEAFEEFVGESVGRAFYDLPPIKISLDPPLESLVVERDSSEVQELLRARQAFSERFDAFESSELSEEEKTSVTNAMNMVHHEDRLNRVPPVVLLVKGVPEAGDEQLLMDLLMEEDSEESEEHEEGGGNPETRPIETLDLEEPPLVLPLTDFPIPEDDEVRNEATRLDTPLVLSLELAQAVQAFARRFPLSPTHTAAPPRAPSPLPPPLEKRPPKAKTREEKRQAVETNLKEMRKILEDILGYPTDQVEQWLRLGFIDPENEEDMRILDELEERVKQMEEDAEARVRESETTSKVMKDRLDTLHTNWNEAEERVRILKKDKRRLQGEIETLQKERPEDPSTSEELKELREKLEVCEEKLNTANRIEVKNASMMRRYTLMEQMVRKIGKVERNRSFSDFFVRGETGGWDNLVAYAQMSGLENNPTELVATLPITTDSSMSDEERAQFEDLQTKRDELGLHYGLSDEQLTRLRRWRDGKIEEDAERKKKLRESLRRARVTEPIPKTFKTQVTSPNHPPTVTTVKQVKKEEKQVKKEEKQVLESLSPSPSSSVESSSYTQSSPEPTALSQALKNADSDDTAFGLSKPPTRGAHPPTRTVQLVLTTEVGQAMTTMEKDEGLATSIFTHESNVHTAAFSTSTLLNHQHRGLQHSKQECAYVDSAIQKYSGIVSTSLWGDGDVSSSGMNEPPRTWYDPSSEDDDDDEECEDEALRKKYQQKDVQWEIPSSTHKLSDSSDEKDMVWPTQSASTPYSTSGLSGPTASVRRYGVSSGHQRHYGMSITHRIPPPLSMGMVSGKKSHKIKEQARSAITMLVAGTLAIASTRIYQSSRRSTNVNKRDYTTTTEGRHDDDEMVLKQLTMPKRFDDSCRRANKESDTIPSMESLILKEWTGLISTPSGGGGTEILLPLVQRLSGAIETGHSKEAREAMLLLCRLASFSKNVQVTMLNMVKEMHAATSRFRCTNNRNEMMECVKRANAIRI